MFSFFLPIFFPISSSILAQIFPYFYVFPLVSHILPRIPDYFVILKYVLSFKEGHVLSMCHHCFDVYFQVSREDVLSVWSGIRPLVKDPQVESTSAVLREHLLSIESNGLISVGGGKWTTYRRCGTLCTFQHFSHN